MERKRLRNSNIEALRIVSMLFIIAFHSARMGYLDKDQTMFIRILSTVLCSWGILGVDLFLIISIWFLVDQEFRLKRVISVIFQTFTYLVLFQVLRSLSYWNDTRSITALGNEVAANFLGGLFQPLWAKEYWFVTAYVFMLLLSPFANLALKKLKKIQVKKLLIVFSFIPIYAQFSDYSPVCDIFYFAYFYLLIGYWKKYKIDILSRLQNFSGVFTTILLFLLASIICLFFHESGWQENIGILLKNTLACKGRHSMIMMFLAWITFGTVIKKKSHYNKWINAVSGTTLGIYLFHENPHPNVCIYLMKKFTKLGMITTDILFPIQLSFAVTIIFLLGMVAELLRQRLLQKPFEQRLLSKYDRSIEKMNKWLSEE